MRKQTHFSAILAAGILLLPAVTVAQTTDSKPAIDYGQEPPGENPELFLPEIFLDGTHSAPAIMPDGREMYWSRYYTPEGSRSRTQHIFVSRFRDGKWSDPEVATFSGNFSDGGPVITSDGSRLFFYSNRPAATGGEPSDEYISDLWFVARRGESWGLPQRLGFNTDHHEGMASVTDNDVLYFQSNRPGTRGVFDCWKSEYANGEYQNPVNLGTNVNSQRINFSPFVAPDESYVIVAYNNNDPNNGLHISFKDAAGNWTKAVSMGKTINVTSVQRFAGLSPDGKYLFFMRAGRGLNGMYWVDAQIIENLRKQVLGE